MQIHYDNMWAISIIQNIKRPTIFNQDLRNVELDARGQNAEAEKCFTDEDMWQVHDS